MRLRHRLLCMLGVAALAGCAAERPAPTPAPAPVRPAPLPPPPPAPTPPAVEWQDLPLTPGVWTYQGEPSPQASFGSGAPSFIFRCDLQNRRVLLIRPGTTTGNTIGVHTSETRKALPIAILQDGSAAPYASLTTEDSLLDSIVFSRGRFSIEVPGLPMLVIPSWPEPARVLEECRR